MHCIKVSVVTDINTRPDSVVCLTQEPEVPGSISGLATYFRFPVHRFKKGNCNWRKYVHVETFSDHQLF